MDRDDTERGPSLDELDIESSKRQRNALVRKRKKARKPRREDRNKLAMGLFDKGAQIPYVTRTIRYTDSKWTGRTWWCFSCEHTRKLGRQFASITQMVPWLEKHVECRYEWHQLARLARESEIAYHERLAQIFPFSIATAKASERTVHVWSCTKRQKPSDWGVTRLTMAEEPMSHNTGHDSLSRKEITEEVEESRSKSLLNQSNDENTGEVNSGVRNGISCGWVFEECQEDNTACEDTVTRLKKSQPLKEEPISEVLLSRHRDCRFSPNELLNTERSLFGHQSPEITNSPNDDQEWDGVGIFQRPRDLKFMGKEMALGTKPLVITGPPQSGKHTLVKQLYDSHIAAARGSHALWVECKEDVAHELLCAIIKWLKTSNKDFNCGEDMQPKEGSKIPDDWDQSMILQEITRRLKQDQCRLSVFIANVSTEDVLENKEVLASLLPELSRSRISACFVAADCLLADAFREGKIPCKVQRVGNLQEQQAHLFLVGVLKQVGRSVQLDKHWKEICRVCGGNPGLLITFCHRLDAYDTVTAALESMIYDCHEHRRSALEDQSARIQAQYREAVRIVLQAPNRAVPTSALLPKLKKLSLDLSDMIEKGILLLREVSYLASDLPKEVYGPLREQAVTFPSRAQEIMWEETLCANS